MLGPWKFSLLIFTGRRKTSLEISIDILAVREKCLWKFPVTSWLCEKMSVEISNDILQSGTKLLWEFLPTVETSVEIQNFHRHYAT